MSQFSISEVTSRWCRENNIEVEAFDNLTSTNDVAKDEAFKTSSPLKVYITDQQSAGRGRGQNHWLNPGPGNGLLWSWSLPLPLSPQHLTGPLIGIALYQSLSEIWPDLEWSIKAPNDIYLKDKKVAGFLVESLNQGGQAWVIIGLGLNVFDHPENVPHAEHIVSTSGVEELSEEQWIHFLNCFRVRLEKSLEMIVQTTLDVSHREILLKALNANPWKQDTFIDVSENGDLVSHDKTISWLSL